RPPAATPPKKSAGAGCARTIQTKEGLSTRGSPVSRAAYSPAVRQPQWQQDDPSLRIKEKRQVGLRSRRDKRRGGSIVGRSTFLIGSRPENLARHNAHILERAQDQALVIGKRRGDI